MLAETSKGLKVRIRVKSSFSYILDLKKKAVIEQKDRYSITNW